MYQQHVCLDDLAKPYSYGYMYTDIHAPARIHNIYTMQVQKYQTSHTKDILLFSYITACIFRRMKSPMCCKKVQ